MTPEEAAGRFVTRNNRNIRLANQMMEQLAGELGCRFIDVNEGLTDDQGRLRKEFTPSRKTIVLFYFSGISYSAAA